MNELKLTELDMGTSIPSILSASKPTINDRGKNPVEQQEHQGWLHSGCYQGASLDPKQGGFSRHMSSHCGTDGGSLPLSSAGLWVDMEVTYSGSLQMTLETKMNLCKLRKEGAAEDSGQVEPCGEG